MYINAKKTHPSAGWYYWGFRWYATLETIAKWWCATKILHNFNGGIRYFYPDELCWKAPISLKSLFSETLSSNLSQFRIENQCTIWLFNIAMERSIVKFGKASISMGHLYRFHGYVSHTQRVNIYPNIIKHELNIPHHPHGEVIPRLQGGAHRPVRSTLPGSIFGHFLGNASPKNGRVFMAKWGLKPLDFMGRDQF